jgi:hypothetical protein
MFLSIAVLGQSLLFTILAVAGAFCHQMPPIFILYVILTLKTGQTKNLRRRYVLSLSKGAAKKPVTTDWSCLAEQNIRPHISVNLCKPVSKKSKQRVMGIEPT